MQIEEAKKILKGMFYNDNGEKMHYIDFSDSYGDEWGGYTLPEYIEAIETVLNELDKKDKRIKKIPDIEVIGDQKMWDINESNDPLTVTMFLKINELTDEINKLNERR